MSDKIWCKVCEEWVDPKDLKLWKGDERRHYLCPGCDSDLLPIESIPDYDDYLDCQHEEET